MYIQDTTLEEVTGFEWDNGNRGKNLLKHGVMDEECEEVFFDQNKKVSEDIGHSYKEKRHILIGQTKKQRRLFLVFTLRSDKIRVVSARDLNRRKHKP